MWNSFSVTGPVHSLPPLPLPVRLALLLLPLPLLPLRGVEAEEDEELLRTRRMLLMTSGCEAL